MTFMDITTPARPRPPFFQPFADAIVELKDLWQMRQRDIALRELSDHVRRDIGAGPRTAERFDGRDEARRLGARMGW